MQILATKELRQLDALDEMGKPRFISSGSGICSYGGKWFCVADDELYLVVFDALHLPGRLVRLLPGVLPEEFFARKAAKPDWESMTVVPSKYPASNGGASLLLLPSGSKGTRHTGAIVELSADGVVITFDLIDCSDLYKKATSEIGELNIEGVACSGNSLLLFNRGNGNYCQNAVLTLDLSRALQSIVEDKQMEAKSFHSSLPINLGELQGVGLGFTDAFNFGAQFLFTAAAEDTANAVDDGPCMGSVIGLLNEKLEISWIKRKDRRTTGSGYG